MIKRFYIYPLLKTLSSNWRASLRRCRKIIEPAAPPWRKRRSVSLHDELNVTKVYLSVLWLTSISIGHAEPLTLDDCIAYGVEHSPTLLQEQLRHTNQQLNVIIQRAAFDPTLRGTTQQSDQSENTQSSLEYDQTLPWGLDFSADYTSSTRESEDAGGIDSTRLSVSLSKKLLGDGGWLKSRQAIRDSLSNALIQGNRVHLERRRLVFQIKQDYYRLIRNLQTLTIQELRLERSKQNLERAILREDPLDIANARIQVPDDEISVIRAKQSIQRSAETLKRRIGMPVDSPHTISDEFTYTPVSTDVDDALEHALGHHEQILNAYLEQDIRRRNAKVEQWDRFPVVELGVRYTEDDEDGGELEQDTRLEASIAWPLGARADRAVYQQALLDIEDQEIEIFDQHQQRQERIRDLGRQLEEAVAAVDLQEQRVKVGERRLELFSDRWENGEIDILELIRSQNDLENDKVQLVNLKTTYMELLAEFEFEAALQTDPLL